jgi:hypothetical protein
LREKVAIGGLRPPFFLERRCFASAMRKSASDEGD